MPVTLQSLDVTVFVVARHVLTETVRVRADTCCLAVGGIQHAVQSVVCELETADGAFIPGLPGHAADAAVVLRSTHTRVVVQVLCEACTADARQPATQVVGICQFVDARSVILLGQQTTEVVISGFSTASQCMLHLAHPVSIVVAVSVYFLSCSLSGSGK